MKITKIETLTCSTYKGYSWVQIYTDEGLVGLGETNSGDQAVVGYIHENAVPFLLGQDPLARERHYATLSRISALGGMGHRANGAEMRGLSAIDVALWDIFGQSIGLPVYRCMGGPVRDRIRTYNTCANDGTRTSGPYLDDYSAWREGRAGELAQSLLEMGITAMKIWPFDPYADERYGHMGGRPMGGHITLEELKEGLRPFREIREAVGDKIEIALEMHLRWSLPGAVRIAKAVEEYRPMWFEDPMPADNAADLAKFSSCTNVPTTISETLVGRYAFREILETQAAGIVMLDPIWIGGFSEARRVANLAEAYHRPFAPHDCAGPICYVAGTHLCMALPNAMIQESVRAMWDGGWYCDVVTEMPHYENGTVAAPSGPGLGTKLLPDFASREDVTVKVAEL